MKTDERILRVEKMEKHFDKTSSALENYKKALDGLLAVQQDVAELDRYCQSGEWMSDFEADEAGKLPKDQKRGVLSEDGLFNLLDEYDYYIAPLENIE